jgi:hypothetical protein
MGDGKLPPPGGGVTDKPPDTLPASNLNSLPDQRTRTSAWAGAGVSGGINMKTRTFAQIIQDEKNQRNILEIQLNKIVTNNTDPKSLTYEDIGELLFDVLEINPDDCISFNFNTGRYDQREIKFKPSINTSKFLRVEPITFKEHTITVKKQRQNIIRVSFKNVPLNVPDEEILTLCAAYGKAVDNCVQYERLNNIKGRA